jgi:predicted flap endonuclease-1-like 5' DNA nuclease
VPTIPVSNPTLTLVDVRGIGAATEDRLRASGITSVDMLASANAKDVADALGYQDITRAQALIDEAAKLLGS